MHLTNRTSTITVALVAALVALAIVAHASRALTFSPSQTAWHGTAQDPPPTIVTAIPGPSGTIGDPGVPCLQGFVWRQVVLPIDSDCASF